VNGGKAIKRFPTKLFVTEKKLAEENRDRSFYQSSGRRFLVLIRAEYLYGVRPNNKKREVVRGCKKSFLISVFFAFQSDFYSQGSGRSKSFFAFMKSFTHVCDC
jgi:hypothetical protein